MGIIQVASGIATICSFAFAIWSYVQRRRSDQVLEINQHVIAERLRAVNNISAIALQNIQILIRRSDDQSAPVPELQNMGRAVRSDLIGLSRALQGANEALQGWNKFRPISSQDIELKPEK